MALKILCVVPENIILPPQKGVFLRPPPHPFGNSNEEIPISLHIWSKYRSPHPQEIPISSLGEGEYGYFLELYNVVSTYQSHFYYSVLA